MLLLIKWSLLKIKNSVGRFLSVILIVALGTGFFAGLREASPDMINTIDTYYDDTKLMDYKITSTMGLNDDDINSLKELDNVSEVIPSYSVDVLVDGLPTRIHAIENDVNITVLKEGKMPENENECLGDKDYFHIGDTISFEKDDLNNYTSISSCKITGLIDSSLYLGKEKGIANIGNGKLETFVFIPKEAFNMEYYTEAYLIAKGTIDEVAYSDEYEENLKKLDNELKELKPIRETARYEEILEEGMKAITDAENKLKEETEKAQNELNDAKTKLDDSQAQINSGYNALNQAQNELNQKKSTYENQINNGLNQINNGYNTLNEQLAAYNITRDNLQTQIDALNAMLEVCETECETLKTQVETLKTISNTYTTLDNQKQELERQRNTLNTEITNGQAEINRQRNTLNQSQTEVNQGYQEYEEGLQTLNNEINDATNQINEQKEALNNLEKPVWYLLDRTSNNGYTNFYEDASKVEAIAAIFPVFFILVASLMCLNTMTRLIEEERTELGIFTSLGYSNKKIIFGYIFYCLIATIIGVAIGLSIGYTLIPTVIYDIYNSNYILPDLILNVTAIPFILMVIYAILLLSLVTIIVCHKELKNKPAVLLRPKAPKNGKKVLLEKITPIWRHLSFTWKITIRNIFRYKKRVFMTIIGVAGCTALLLTGFGLKDGINSIGNIQYETIQKYDALISLRNNIETIPENMNSLLKDNGFTNEVLAYQDAYTFNAKNKNHDAYLISPANNEDFSKLIYLHSTVTDQDITLPDDGAIITEKMAELLNAEVNQNIKIRDSEGNLHIIKVADITENYTMHYIYMSKEYYENVFGNSNEYNIILANLNNTNYDEISTNLLQNTEINAINYASDNLDSYNTIIDGMNQIVYLIIGCAILLALIVLYNLVIINMNERKREIATFKVLGFKNKEISSYVYRETIILTIIGIGLGLLLGILLDHYVIITAEPDNIIFLKEINPLSYVYAIVLTIIATIIVKICTYRYLLKIDMIESLKALDQ